MGGEAHAIDFWPCLLDRTTKTSIDAHYFYQAIWAFGQIFNGAPVKHVDIGSDVRFVGMLTTITKVNFVDIRPLALKLENYHGIDGSISDLPFSNASLNSVSCMHVIEHIGLGRYGDPLDPTGSYNACRELVRVLAVGGRLYISLPIGASRVQFNGQRVFLVKEVMLMFDGLKLLEMAIVDAGGNYFKQINIDDNRIAELENKIADFGLGMFVFTKM